MVYCGIDPGLSGAICFYDPASDWLEVHDCPVLRVNGKGEVSLPGLKDILGSAKVSSCVIERAQAMPGQGVSSMFNYGKGYGCYLGMLAAMDIRYTRISPQEWKKALRVPQDKDGAIARASELLPAHTHLWSRKKDHGRAEAALLAYYGATSA